MRSSELWIVHDLGDQSFVVAVGIVLASLEPDEAEVLSCVVSEEQLVRPFIVRDGLIQRRPDREMPAAPRPIYASLLLVRPKLIHNLQPLSDFGGLTACGSAASACEQSEQRESAAAAG
jgi:hypothetical protein